MSREEYANQNRKKTFAETRLSLFLLGFVNAFEAEENPKPEFDELKKYIQNNNSLEKYQAKAINPATIISGISKNDYNDGKKAAINLLQSALLSSEESTKKTIETSNEKISNITNNALTNVSSIGSLSIQVDSFGTKNIKSKIKTTAFNQILKITKGLEHGVAQKAIVEAIKKLSENIIKNPEQVAKTLNNPKSSPTPNYYFVP